ncbi:MAG: hypothetical protein VCF24_24550 [Candidatus Latescibacterota bacterium]
MYRRRLSRTAALAFVLVLVGLPPMARAQKPLINVGLVVEAAPDGGMREALAEEVGALMEREFDVRFSSEYTVNTDGTVDGARQALALLYRATAVDLVIAGGPVVSQVAITEYAAGAPKPTVAPVVLHANLQGAPLQDQSSGVTNYNYIAHPADVAADLGVFLQVVEMSQVTFLLASPTRAAIPGLDDDYLAAAETAGLSASVIDGDGDAGALLAALPPEADAVYLAQPLGLSSAGLQQLAQGLIELRLPSFVAIGTSQVTAGLLVGLHSDADVTRLARRVALNIQRILLGEPAATIPVFFQRSVRLTINTSTAEALGVSPSWSVLTEAELVGTQATAAGRQLDLVAAVREATSSNLELAAQIRAVAAGRSHVREAKARLCRSWNCRRRVCCSRKTSVRRCRRSVPWTPPPPRARPFTPNRRGRTSPESPQRPRRGLLEV